MYEAIKYDKRIDSNSSIKRIDKRQLLMTYSFPLFVHYISILYASHAKKNSSTLRSYGNDKRHVLVDINEGSITWAIVEQKCARLTNYVVIY